ncbi:MAG: hypothetical protein AB7D05_07970 [Mangrovibacterium sp.]
MNRKMVLPVFLILTVLVALQYTVFSVAAVNRRMKVINRQVDVRLLAPVAVVGDKAWIRLYKEKDWLQTRLQIARTDSISLSVNLPDSTMQIELKGVVLKKIRLLDFRADCFLRELQPIAYHHLFGKQARAERVIASIPKQPLVIKKAPKDTLEAGVPRLPADSARINPVSWMMQLDNGVILQIRGMAAPEAARGSGRASGFIIARYLRQTFRDMAYALVFRVPEYQPEIRLVIPLSDAIAVFRALPETPLVCIRL